MSLSTRRPLRMLGGAHKSGNIYTGEVPITRGGQLKGVVWSGSLLVGLTSGTPGATSSGGHIIFFSGGGRLNSVMPHLQMQSGLAVFFYDAGAIAVSGISVSGQWILGQIPPTHRLDNVAGFQSGYGFSTPWQDVLQMDSPFISGLCAACPSGTPGFTVFYTPEFDPALPAE